MFQDLVLRSQQAGQTVKLQNERRKEVRLLFLQTIEDVIEEIESLGFVKVDFSTVLSIQSFSLRLQCRQGYSYQDYTYNLELSSTGTNINYGYGANSAKGKQMHFDYNWNNSKLVATMKNALRALLSDALKSLEVGKANGWV